jgi:heme-degrading monooxygenase HmoA
MADLFSERFRALLGAEDARTATVDAASAGHMPRSIVRIWHGRTRADRADAYTDYLERTGVADFRRTPGNLGVDVLKRVVGVEAEFLVVSRWESFEAVKAFAGEDVTRARYYPLDSYYLLELEPNVVHYETALEGELKKVPGSKVQRS